MLERRHEGKELISDPADLVSCEVLPTVEDHKDNVASLSVRTVFEGRKRDENLLGVPSDMLKRNYTFIPVRKRGPNDILEVHSSNKKSMSRRKEKEQITSHPFAFSVSLTKGKIFCFYLF